MRFQFALLQQCKLLYMIFALSVFAQGCAGLIGVSAGPSYAPSGTTTVGPAVAAVNAHYEIGTGTRGEAIIVGLDANIRANPSYVHMDIGPSIGVLRGRDRWMGAARASLNPFGFSVLNSSQSATISVGGELMLGYAPTGSSERGRFTNSASGTGITLSLRADIERRLSNGQGDVFIGLLLGLSGYAIFGLQ